MRKLYRSQRDKKVFGICGGLSEIFNVDATLLRLLMVATTFFTGGTMIAIYVIAALVIPKEPGYHAPDLKANHSYHNGPFQGQPAVSGFPKYDAAATAGTSHNHSNHLDEMMKEVERKAMWKEIEELRAKVAKYEKGDV